MRAEAVERRATMRCKKILSVSKLYPSDSLRTSVRVISCFLKESPRLKRMISGQMNRLRRHKMMRQLLSNLPQKTKKSTKVHLSKRSQPKTLDSKRMEDQAVCWPPRFKIMRTKSRAMRKMAGTPSIRGFAMRPSLQEGVVK